MTANIKYETTQIAQFHSAHRSRWDDFYPSERWVIEHIAGQGRLGRVLDIGCAAGGLGLALGRHFEIASYTGVDINRAAIEAAEARRHLFPMPARFHCADILEARDIGEPFDTVVNLSCADWNVESEAIINASWERVAEGGWLIISLRLTNQPGINDFSRSYQIIRYDGSKQNGTERANYVVFNVADALDMFASLTPAASDLIGYGYWGRPSHTAVTPYENLVFAVFGAGKSRAGVAGDMKTELRLPLSLFARVASRSDEATVAPDVLGGR